MRRIAGALLALSLASVALAAPEQKPAAPAAPGFPGAAPAATTPRVPGLPAPAAAAAKVEVPVYLYKIVALGRTTPVNRALKEVTVVDVTVSTEGRSKDGKTRIWKLRGTFRNTTPLKQSPKVSLVLSQGKQSFPMIALLEGGYTISPQTTVAQEKRISLPAAVLPDGFGVTEQVPTFASTAPAGTKPTPGLPSATRLPVTPTPQGPPPQGGGRPDGGRRGGPRDRDGR